MDRFEKNMSVIEQKDKEWHDKIIAFENEEHSQSIDWIESSLAKDGEPYMTICKGETTIRMNSLYSPKHEASVWAKQFSCNDVDNIVMMYGLGNGYFVREIMKNMDEDAVIFIYEPSAEVFLHGIKNYDLEDIIRNPKVVIGVQGINEFTFHIVIKEKISVTNLSSQIICVHPFYDTLFPEGFKQFYIEIKESVQVAQVLHNTVLHFADTKVNNTFKNAKYLRDCITVDDLKEVFPKDLPVILVAAGPSLMESLDDLKKAKGKAAIIAVDRALDTLLNNGIKPDFVATMDPLKYINNFSSRDEITIPLFCIMQSQPMIMEKHNGKKILCEVGEYLQNVFTKVKGKYPMVPLGGSVANMVFSIAIHLGTKKLIFVGQDLAFSGDVTHAGGVISNPHGQDVEMVPGVKGNKVRSRYDWKAYLDWFGDMIELLPEIEFIDTKSDGAKIKGTVNMSLSEALDMVEDKNIDFDTIVAGIQPTFKVDEYEQLVNFFTDSVKEIEYIKRKSKEGSGLCSDVLLLYKEGKTSSKQIDNKLEKISIINKDISERSIYALVEEMIIKAANDKYVKAFKSNGNIDDDTVQVIDTTGAMFEAAIDCMNYIEPLMKPLIELFTIQE